jgi:hypothetical protein
LKNFYINNKNLTCFFLLVLWSLSLSSLGCSSISNFVLKAGELIMRDGTDKGNEGCCKDVVE